MRRISALLSFFSPFAVKILFFLFEDSSPDMQVEKVEKQVIGRGFLNPWKITWQALQALGEF